MILVLTDISNCCCNVNINHENCVKHPVPTENDFNFCTVPDQIISTSAISLLHIVVHFLGVFDTVM